MDHFDDLSRRDLIRTTGAAAALAAAGLASAGPDTRAQDGRWSRDRETVGSATAVVRGVVYLDSAGTGRRETRDPGLEGVLVSNGHEVTRTDSEGRYLLPIAEGDTIFVIKPSGLALPLDPETCLPRFAFTRRPTGPLPDSVDFGLVENPEPGRFDVAILADPQPEIHAEIDFVKGDVVNDLIGTKAAFGITTGEIMFDDPSLHGCCTRIVGQIGLPCRNIGGNSDERVSGPAYYAFEYGEALFLMLDNVEYLGTDPTDPKRKEKYRGHFGKRQLAFVENLLAATPQDRLVVAAMRVPLKNYLDPADPALNTSDRLDFLSLLGRRPAVSFAGYTHATEHHYFGYQDALPGLVPHHHHILARVSGSSWGGSLDRRGIASADDRDGTPHGSHVLSIDGNSYTTRFVPADETDHRQLRIGFDHAFHGSRPAAGTCPAGPMPGSRLSRDELAATNLRR